VRVNAVSPGAIRTDTVFTHLGPDAFDGIGVIPTARAAEPTEIAEVILFLASPRSSYVTGATLAADGGATAI